MTVLYDKKVLVTGGAGFIGNSLVKKLLENHCHVCVVDNFSKTNHLKNINEKNLIVINADCKLFDDMKKIPYDFDILFHLAADPEVNLSVTNLQSIYENNILATKNILEWFKNSESKIIVFTSTSTVYGEAKVIPTPESYNPCYPISFYGGSKLACEAMISSWCHTFNKQGIIFRLANIVGSLSDHGIIPDMIKKLSHSKETIEILGDGHQIKSYLYIDDCIDGILQVLNHENNLMSTYNIGSETQISVNEIVDIILSELHLANKTKKIFTGGIDGGRGWIGDVKEMLLDITKIKKKNWQPKFDSKQAVEKTVRDILQYQKIRNNL